MKRIPYGIENFDRLIRGNYYFVDHSQYIEYIEKRASYILLLRPRRMGKSLFSSMLMSYYDIAKKDYFNELFGNLYIGQHPTPDANKYVVLKLDFSKIGKVDIEELPEAFFQYCKFEINYTFSYYGDLFTASEKETVLSGANAERLVDTFDKIVKSKGLQSYLFIDEYDNFSNTVLTTHGVKAHEKITHGEGFYREFFKCCKGNFDRIYMTGVAPVTYDDLTSGFNIASIIALEPKYNHILGISETELRTMIDYYRNEGCFEMETDAVIAEMKPWYDNFCFSSYCYGKEAPIFSIDLGKTLFGCWANLFLIQGHGVVFTIFETEVEEEVVAQHCADAGQLLGVDSAHAEDLVHVGASAAYLSCEPTDTDPLLQNHFLYSLSYVHKIRGSQVFCPSHF